MRLLAFAAVFAAAAVSTSAQYDSTTSMAALYYCKAAYCDVGSIQSWSCPACSFHSSFTAVSAFHNGTIDSQAFTGYDTNQNTIVVSFRGSSNIENWFNDLDFIMTTYPNPACNCNVHQGFLEEYQSLQNDVMSSVQSLVSSYPSAPILVTGHSLGAAVSILSALDLAQAYPSNSVTVYNFGQPRVGDDAFAAWASSILPLHKQFRVTHSRDPVPHVPPMVLGFLHTPHELWYDNDGSGSWSDCQDSATNEDPNCSDSVIPYGIEDHLLYLGVSTGCSASASPRRKSVLNGIQTKLKDIANGKGFFSGRDRRRK